VAVEQSSERTALVTGASQGIGLGVAIRLASEGIQTAIVGRDHDKIISAAVEIHRRSGVKPVTIIGDVSSWDDCQRIASKAEAELGSIDILVPNAGVGVIGTVAEADPNDWVEMMNINYLGTAQMVKAVLPAMEKQGHGDVIAIVSAGGTKGYPEWSGYCATKWAVLGFMDSFAQEVISEGIRVTTLCPGGVDTPFWDNLNKDVNRAGTESRGKLMSPANVAELVLLQLNLPRNVMLKSALFFPTNEWH
jgi:3-oxoacyl-[acyl-carrier protein] reductase